MGGDDEEQGGQGAAPGHQRGPAAGSIRTVAVSAADRRRKLRLVTDYLCFFQPADLLFHYRDQAVVPGICTEHFCDCIITIGCDEAAGWCPQCDRDTLQSILIFAGTH